MSEENNEQIIETPIIEEASVIEPAPIIEEAPVFEPAPHIVVEAPQPQPEENVITAPSFPVSEVPAIGIVEHGVIGSTVAPVASVVPKPEKQKVKEETVALFSTKNVSWSEAGKVYRGYNFVSKSEADKWLTRDHIRLATPEEVAKEFGK